VNELKRLQEERAAWFFVARELAQVIMSGVDGEEALNDYLRLRGRLEDPRDALGPT
jgi:hypothetical protein